MWWESVKELLYYCEELPSDMIP